MATLVICEKPSVARDVASALSTRETFQQVDWGYQSPTFWVTAAAGHLVEMCAPEQYDERYKTWSFDDLPIIVDQYRYQPRDQRGAARLGTLSKLLGDQAVVEVVNACDAGREGELIFALIYQAAKSTKPVQRAWFNSMTQSAILDAFNQLRPGADMAGLEAAARCRSEADWVVGMNATRAASCTLGGGRGLLSIGRVQTPTLAIVVQRDVEIDRFVATAYYQISGTFDLGGERRLTGWWRSSNEAGSDDRFDDKAAADGVAAQVRAAGSGSVHSVDVKVEQVAAPKLFDLTSLQREVNKRYGISAARTLAAAQALYEEHKYLTYPRTDSCFITSDMAGDIAGLVTLMGANGLGLDDAVAAAQTSMDVAKVVNNAKVTDHHAIIPTGAAVDLSRLDDDQRKVYELVCRRFLAALLPAQVLERTTIWFQVPVAGGAVHWFRSTGRRELAPGWRVAWPEAQRTKKSKAADDDGDDSDGDGDGDEVCAATSGEPGAVVRVEVASKMTKAPSRHTEASVLAAMEGAGRLVDDDDLSDAMRERGLGTPATRAAILETLLDRSYLERQGRSLVATDKGRGLILALGDHPLARPDLTGEWEQRLRQLERTDDGDQVRDLQSSFRDQVQAFTREIVAGFTGKHPDQLRAGRRTLGVCPMPDCDGQIVASVKGWGCNSWKSREETGCGFVFWKEQSGKKRTEKDLSAYVAKVASGEVVVLRGPATRVVLGACPRCGEDVVERAKGWGCSSWKSPKETGCGYVIWKTNPDKSDVSGQQAAAMLAAGETNARVATVFAPCPVCDGSVVDRGTFYGCDSWKSQKQAGCGVMLWKQSRGVALGEDEIRAELDRQGREGPPAPRATTKRAKGTKSTKPRT
jgi:DNA topoisomerase III